MNAAPRENRKANGTLNGSAIVVQIQGLAWIDSTRAIPPTSFDLTSLDLLQS
jgi:hypothetical protein